MKRIWQVGLLSALLCAGVVSAEAADRYVMTSKNGARMGEMWVYDTPRGAFADVRIETQDPPYDPMLRASGRIAVEENDETGTVSKHFVIGSAEYVAFQNVDSYKTGVAIRIISSETVPEGMTYEGEMGPMLGNSFTLGNPDISYSFDSYDGSQIVNSTNLLPPPDGVYVLAEKDVEKEWTADVAKVFLKNNIFWNMQPTDTDERYYDIVLLDNARDFSDLPEDVSRYYSITVYEPGEDSGTWYMVDVNGRYIFRVNEDLSLTKIYDVRRPF